MRDSMFLADEDMLTQRRSKLKAPFTIRSTINTKKYIEFCIEGKENEECLFGRRGIAIFWLQNKEVLLSSIQ
jgi:hypothetical protein